MRIAGNLVCTVPGCGKVIKAWTGLQELEELQNHMYVTHLVNWTMEETMRNRELIETRRPRREL